MIELHKYTDKIAALESVNSALREENDGLHKAMSNQGFILSMLIVVGFIVGMIVGWGVRTGGESTSKAPTGRYMVPDKSPGAPDPPYPAAEMFGTAGNGAHLKVPKSPPNMACNATRWGVIYTYHSEMEDPPGEHYYICYRLDPDKKYVWMIID